MDDKNMAKSDFITSIVLILFSVGIVYMSIQMPRFEHRGINPLSVPGIVPGILGGIIGLFGIIMFIRSVKQKGYNLKDLFSKKTVDWFCKPASIRLWLTILLAVGYAWGLVGRIAYPVATFIFIFSFIMIFEYDSTEKKKKAEKKKKLLKAILTAVIASLVISIVFEYLFLIRLP